MRIKKTDMSDSKRIAKNTMLLYFRMILVMGVSLYTSRIVLKELGVSDYGVYSLVGGFIGLFSFLNGAMSSATQRYLTFDLGKKDDSRLQKTFSITLTIHAAIALIVLLLAETIGLWYVNHKMIFPPERAFAVNVVYQLSIAASIVSVIQVPYNALIIARERMNIFAYISIVEVSLRLVIVFMLVWFGADKLIVYAVLTFIVSLLIQLFYQLYCQKNYRESKYRFEWDKAYYKELIAYSGWNLFGSLAAVARSQGNNVVLNLFFGTTVNAAYGVASQVQSAVSVFVNNFQMAVNPQIIKRYAQNKFNEMQSLIFQSAKFSYLLLFVLTVPIIINVDYILNVWLKIVPEYSSDFLVLSLIYLLIDSLSFSLMKAVQATGNIKLYQLIIGSFIFLNLPLSYLILKLGGSPTSVFVILIVITALSLLIRMFFVEKLLGFKPIVFVKSVLLPIAFVTFLVGVISYSFYSFLIANTVFELFIYSLIIISYTLIIAIAIGLSKSEKKLLSNLIRNKMKWKR